MNGPEAVEERMEPDGDCAEDTESDDESSEVPRMLINNKRKCTAKYRITAANFSQISVS